MGDLIEKENAENTINKIYGILQVMLVCSKCGKGKNIVNFSRHKKGSSGAGGTWALRAPIHKRIQLPNLHVYLGKRYCTKCLRIVKKPFNFVAKIAQI